MFTRYQTRLPIEIVEKIILDFEASLPPRKWEIKAFYAAANRMIPLTRVCRQWRSVAERRLYHTIILDVTEGSRYDGRQGLAGLRARRLLNALENNTVRSGYVRQLVLRCSLMDDSTPKKKKIWERLSHNIFFDWQLDRTIRLVGCLGGIVECCYNLQHFLADEGSALPALLIQSNLEAKLTRVKTFVVPVLEGDMEQTYARRHVTPIRMLYMIEQWPEIEEVQVKSFFVYTLATSDAESVIKRDYRKLVNAEGYSLNARFFREFRSIWKKNVADFSGTICKDEETVEELIKCLGVWGHSLVTLRLGAIDVDWVHNNDSVPPKLTKAISELPELRTLCISSAILPPTALTNPALNGISSLQYNFKSLGDFVQFTSIFTLNWERKETKILLGLVRLNFNHSMLEEMAAGTGQEQVLIDLEAVISDCCRKRGVSLRSYDFFNEATNDSDSDSVTAPTLDINGVPTFTVAPW